MSKINYQISRSLNPSLVRGMCIKYNLYTAGDIEDYSKMLGSCRDANTDSQVIDIANDIMLHSDDSDMSSDISTESLIWILLSRCTDIHVGCESVKTRNE